MLFRFVSCLFLFRLSLLSVILFGQVLSRLSFVFVVGFFVRLSFVSVKLFYFLLALWDVAAGSCFAWQHPST